MNKINEYKASSLIPQLSSCWSKSNSGTGWALLAMIFAFFQKAAANPCSNNLTFPYHLEKASENVGYCLPLELPTAQPGVTTTILLSLYDSAAKETARILQCPNVVLSNYTDCCIIQNFEKLASLCNKAMVWQLELDTNMGIEPLAKDLACIEGPQDCPQSSMIVMDVILTFIAVALLCAFLYLIHRGVERFRAYHDEMTDRDQNRQLYEVITK